MSEYDDEFTESCRYMLYSEKPDGDIEFREPTPTGEKQPDSTPRWWVLVKRPSEPPSGNTSGS